MSREAAFVNVTIKILPGTAPFFNILWILRIKVVVFPEPGQLIRRTGPSVASTARLCALFSRNFMSLLLKRAVPSGIRTPAVTMLT
jgi:hypothetical protein